MIINRLTVAVVPTGFSQDNDNDRCLIWWFRCQLSLERRVSITARPVLSSGWMAAHLDVWPKNDHRSRPVWIKRRAHIFATLKTGAEGKTLNQMNRKWCGNDRWKRIIALNSNTSMRQQQKREQVGRNDVQLVQLLKVWLHRLRAARHGPAIQPTHAAAVPDWSLLPPVHFWKIANILS